MASSSPRLSEDRPSTLEVVARRSVGSDRAPDSEVFVRHELHTSAFSSASRLLISANRADGLADGAKDNLVYSEGPKVYKDAILRSRRKSRLAYDLPNFRLSYTVSSRGPHDVRDPSHMDLGKRVRRPVANTDESPGRRQAHDYRQF